MEVIVKNQEINSVSR